MADHKLSWEERFYRARWPILVVCGVSVLVNLWIGVANVVGNQQWGWLNLAVALVMIRVAWRLDQRWQRNHHADIVRDAIVAYTGTRWGSTVWLWLYDRWTLDQLRDTSVWLRRHDLSLVPADDQPVPVRVLRTFVEFCEEYGRG